MAIARWTIVCLIIVALFVANTPASREQMRQGWEDARPGVVALMDGVYAVVRTLINGDGHDDRIDDAPVSPEADFDRVVTMDYALAFD